LYSEDIARKTQNDILSAVQNLGFLNASVDLIQQQKGHNTRLIYYISPGTRYTVRNLEKQIQDTAIDSLLSTSDNESYLSEGMDFDLNVLQSERSRINSLLQNRGYYRFNNEYIHYEADTTVGNQQVDLLMQLRPYRVVNNDTIPHNVFRIGEVSFPVDENAGTRLKIRPKVLYGANELKTGDLYSEDKVQKTYSRLMRLGSVMGANIRFEPDKEDSTLLHTNIVLAPGKPNSVNLELEGTNSAGDFGAAVSTSYQNRNLFHGGELFSITLRGAYEAIKGLNGYSDQDYIEYSVETGITFPDFKFPFVSSKFRRLAQATSEVSLMFDSQDRPEFHRRVVTGTWRYRWNQLSRKRQHKVDLLDLNYVFMPWISDTFRKLYLEDPESRNAILKYNYENLFIMKWGYNFTYSSRPLSGAANNYGTDAYIIRLGAESSGNLLYGLSHLFAARPNAENQYTLFNIAYAQYVKGDFDFSKSFRLDDKNSLALHFGLGVAYPYGNSTILPYEKRYFSGGANSVRGWSVRGLGPGSFNGSDGRIDFINQTGDLKLDLNAEYRTHLFWKIHGAAFIDAGNIWTLRKYAEQPGGQFKIDSFWRQIAVAYGLGLRLNFDYFILRLDGGMKAVHPAFKDAKRHFPIIHPNFNRDFSLHFAVGLPF
jgi:outer membrane protein assembly factor BamA